MGEKSEKRKVIPVVKIDITKSLYGNLCPLDKVNKQISGFLDYYILAAN